MASGREQTAERAKFRHLFILAKHLKEIQQSADGGSAVFGQSLDKWNPWLVAFIVR